MRLLSWIGVMAVFIVALFGVGSGAQTPAKLSAGTNSNVHARGMTVEDVIKLVKAGLSEDIILQQIRKQGRAFDLSADQLIQLKAASVSDRIIAAMMDPTKADTPAPPADVAAALAPAPARTPPAADPSMPAEIGVYAKKQGQWTEVLPEVVYWKTGGVLKTVATAGIVRGDVNGHLVGLSSRNSFAAPIEFLIIAPEGVAITEYQLLRLRQNKDEREFRTVTGGVLHSQGGATRDLVPFEGKKVAPHTFSVVFPGNLGEGEYGFLPPGSNGAGGKIYSFRVRE